VSDPSFLASSLDTVEIAYYLRPSQNASIDFQKLTALRDQARAVRVRTPETIVLGIEEFLLAPHGTASGYPLLMENESFSIQCGEFNRPSFFVTFRSIALWHYGLEELHARFMNWADSVGLVEYQPERVSRVDFAFDFHLDQLDFDEDSFVSLFTKDNQHRMNGVVQTFRLGQGDLILRCYNKSDEISQKSSKTWLYDIWGRESGVWRIEWQTRKEILRSFGISNLQELQLRQGDLLSYLTSEHTRLCKGISDSNRSRWPLHPLWAALQLEVAKLPILGVTRNLNMDSILDERFMRITMSVYGYLKRVAAIRSVQGLTAPIPVGKAIHFLNNQIYRIHDPLTWDYDVQRLMKENRLGQI